MTQRLFTPGPTPVPAQVVARMAEPIIHHRSEEAKAIFRTVHAGLRRVFLTEQPVMILTSSGTGAVEAAMTTLGRVGDKAIVLNNGRFADRWTTMLRLFGLNVIDVKIPWGQPVLPEHASETLKQHPDASMLWVVHSETSTGTYSDIRAIAAAVREHSDALICVDGISSVCAHELRMDEWDLDVVCTGSQKGMMLPPGLAFVSLSERAWKSAERSNVPRYYFDLVKARKSWREDNTPWTPAISLVCGLETALELIHQEGLENVWKRHATFATSLRDRLVAAGYRLYSQQPSNALSALYLPDSRPTLVKDLLREYNMVVASGQDELKSVIFRVGHLGYYHQSDIDAIVEALIQLR